MNFSRPINRGRIRYDWWRAHHGLPQHAKWRSVARAANVPVSVVFHVAVCLLDLASRAHPRGSVAEFKPFDCAGIVDVSLADVERIMVVLTDIHWVEGHMLADWDERQPQREDEGAARRKAEQRANSPTPSHLVTLPKRDIPQSHATEAGQEHQTVDVTNVSAPDIDKDITSSSFVAAREEKPSTGSFASGPLNGPLTRPCSEFAAKRPSEVTRKELDAAYAARRENISR